MSGSILMAASHLGFSSLSSGMLLPSIEYAINVDFLFGFVFSKECEIVHEGVRDKHFHEGIPDDPGCANYDALDVLVGAEGYQLEGQSTVLHN